ncbi:MAG: LytR/AlgR family response regulator transcription factor [Thermoanaerobaculia bacterium]
MPEPIRALIVDDEELARANLRQALRDVPGWQVAGECESVRAARAFLGANAADVIFLDVQMPFESGLVLARELAASETPPGIVFVTAFDQYAVEAFELQALDYLLKPFDDARLATTLERVRELLDLRQRAAYRAAVSDAVDEVEGLRAAREPEPLRRFCIRSVGSIESIAVAAVEWIASAGNYVELHLTGRSVLHRITMAQLEHRLDRAEFLRVHRTAIVRSRLVTALQITGDGSYELILASGARVPVSERYVPEVRALLVDQGR